MTGVKFSKVLAEFILTPLNRPNVKIARIELLEYVQYNGQFIWHAKSVDPQILRFGMAGVKYSKFSPGWTYPHATQSPKCEFILTPLNRPSVKIACIELLEYVQYNGQFIWHAKSVDPAGV